MNNLIPGCHTPQTADAFHYKLRAEACKNKVINKQGKCRNGNRNLYMQRGAFILVPNIILQFDVLIYTTQLINSYYVC